MASEVPLSQRIVPSFGWALTGTTGQVVFQLIALVTLARLLSPKDFGVVAVATIITQLAQVINEFGIGPAIVQRQKLNDDEIRVGFTLSCLLGLLMAAMLWLGAPTVAYMLHTQELTWLIRVYIPIFLVKSYTAVAESLLQKDLAFPSLARADVISFAVGYAGIGILAALGGFSFWSLVFAHLGQSVIKAACVIRARRHPKRIYFDVAIVRQFLKFGLGQSISRLGSYVASQADSLVVARMLGIERLGEYGRANQLIVMPANHLGAIFDKVLFPSFSMVQDDRERFATAYRKALTIIGMLALPVSAFVFVTAEDFVLGLLGEQWGNVVEPVKILSIGLIFRLAHKVSDPTARAIGAIYDRAWRQILSALIMAVCAYVGSGFGIGGVATGVLVAIGLDALLMVQLCSRLSGRNLKSTAVALLPGFRLGLFTLVVVFLIHSSVLQLTRWHLGVCILTIVMSAPLLAALVYGFPRSSLGKTGVDATLYVWSLLNSHKGLSFRSRAI